MNLRPFALILFIHIICILLVKSQQDWCGQKEYNLTTAETNFVFPFSNGYVPPVTCTYVATGGFGNAVALEIKSMKIGHNGHCDVDYVAVAESIDLLENSVKRTCGNEAYTLWVDASVMVFRIHLNTIGFDSHVKASITQKSRMDPPDCGVPALFTSRESGMFEMRRSKKVLPFPSECHYSIRIDNWNLPLMMQITSMTPVPDGICDQNHVQVMSYPDEEGGGKRYCYNNFSSSAFYSSSFTFFMIFVVKHSPQNAQVKAVYSKVRQATDLCGENPVKLSNGLQYFTSPIQENYTGEFICSYVIIGNPGYTIELDIRQIQIGPGGNCEHEYVKAAATDDELRSTTQITCGTEKKKFTVPENVMFVEVMAKPNANGSYVLAVLKQEPVNLGSSTESTPGSAGSGIMTTKAPDGTYSATKISNTLLFGINMIFQLCYY